MYNKIKTNFIVQKYLIENMHTFANKNNENIKFNLSPLVTKINTRYSFESEIIKTLSFFNNKKNKYNLINSSTHKTTINPQSAKIINTSCNTKNNNVQKNIIKYNFKSSLINDILKDNINKINKFKNKVNQSNNNIKKFNSINNKKSNNLCINIDNNANNYFCNYSNKLFSHKNIEKNKLGIKKIKNEINKYNDKKQIISSNKTNHNLQKNNKSNKLYNISNLNNKISSYNNTCRNYFNQKQKDKSNRNKQKKNSINIINNYSIRTTNNSYVKINNNRKNNNIILIDKIKKSYRNSLISSDNNKNKIFSYKTDIPLSSKLNNNFNLNYYTLNSLNSEKFISNEYHTIDNNTHHIKRHNINIFNIFDNSDLIKKKASKTFSGFYKHSSKNIKDHKKNNKKYNIKRNKNNYYNLHIYQNNHNYYTNKYSPKIKDDNFIINDSEKNQNYIHTDNNKFDYKDKLSKIKEKAEGLFENYSKLLKLFTEGKIEINKKI